MVVALGRGSAAEAVAKLHEKLLAKRVQAWVGDGGAELLDFRIVAVLFFANRGITGEEVAECLFVGLVEFKVPAFEAIRVLRPFPFDSENLACGQGVGLLIDRRVRPDFERKMSGGISEGEFEIRLAGFSGARGAGLELRMNGGKQGLFPGLFP